MSRPRAPTLASPAGQAEMQLLLLALLLLPQAPGSSVSSTLPLHPAPPPREDPAGEAGARAWPRAGAPDGWSTPGSGAIPRRGPMSATGTVVWEEGTVGPSSFKEGWDLETSLLALGHSLQKWQRPSALPLQKVLGGTANAGNVLAGWYITVEGRGGQCWHQPRCRARWPIPPDVCHLPGTKLSCSSVGRFGVPAIPHCLWG